MKRRNYYDKISQDELLGKSLYGPRRRIPKAMKRYLKLKAKHN
jgi:hypothetical protein